MRLWIIIFWSLASVANAQVYKTVDADGNVSYTDSPPSKNAEQVDLPNIIVAPATQPKARIKPKQYADLIPPQISLASPANGSTILGSAETIPVRGSVSRVLNDDEFLQLVVNSRPYGPQTKTASWQVGDLIRGQYTLQFRVVKEGKTQASSNISTVQVHRYIAR